MIELKKFSEEYLDKTFLWMQDEKLKESFLLDKEITRNSHRSWFEQLQKDETQKMFAIVYEGEHVGNIGLKNIDFKNRKAESWIYLGEVSHRGKGIARKALEGLSGKMKGEVIKLYARIADFNIPSIKTFISAGYQLEGILQMEMVYKRRHINIYRLCKII